MYWELVITFCCKNKEEMDLIKEQIRKEFPIKQYEIISIKKKHKTEPYPDVNLVYLKD